MLSLREAYTEYNVPRWFLQHHISNTASLRNRWRWTREEIDRIVRGRKIKPHAPIAERTIQAAYAYQAARDTHEVGQLDYYAEIIKEGLVALNLTSPHVIGFLCYQVLHDSLVVRDIQDIPDHTPTID